MAITSPTKTDSRERVAPSTVLTGIDLATGKTIGTVPITPEERIPEIVARSLKAQQRGTVLPFAGRAIVRATLRNIVIKRAKDITETVSHGMRKPLVEAFVGDVGLVLDEFDEYILKTK